MTTLKDIALDILFKNDFLDFIKKNKIIPDEDIKQLEGAISEVKKTYNNEEIVKRLKREEVKARLRQKIALKK